MPYWSLQKVGGTRGGRREAEHPVRRGDALACGGVPMVAACGIPGGEDVGDRGGAERRPDRGRCKAAAFEPAGRRLDADADEHRVRLDWPAVRELERLDAAVAVDARNRHRQPKVDALLGVHAREPSPERRAEHREAGAAGAGSTRVTARPRRRAVAATS